MLSLARSNSGWATDSLSLLLSNQISNSSPFAIDSDWSFSNPCFLTATDDQFRLEQSVGSLSNARMLFEHAGECVKRHRLWQGSNNSQVWRAFQLAFTRLTRIWINAPKKEKPKDIGNVRLDGLWSRGLLFKVKHLEHRSILPCVPRSVQILRYVPCVLVALSTHTADYLHFCRTTIQPPARLFGRRSPLRCSSEFLPAYPFSECGNVLQKLPALFRCPFTALLRTHVCLSSAFLRVSYPLHCADPVKSIRIFTKLAPLNRRICVPTVVTPLVSGNIHTNCSNLKASCNLSFDRMRLASISPICLLITTTMNGFRLPLHALLFRCWTLAMLTFRGS